MDRPEPFRCDDLDRSLALMQRHPLAQLTAVDEAGRASTTPVPVVADRTPDGALRLRFHLALGNPLCRTLTAGREALLAFLGAEGYVSPDWYETSGLPPTWNYEAVQARGAATTVEGDALRALVADLAAQEEARLAPKPSWTHAKMGEERLTAMLRAIRGFELLSPTVEGKAKLSQNRSAADRRGVIVALGALGTDSATALADAMMPSDG